MKLLFRAKPKDMVKFLIYCVFLLYLVAVAVMNIHTFSIEGIFWGLNPFPAFGRDFFFTTIVFYVAALVASIMSVSNFFIERDKGFGFTSKSKEEKGYEKMSEEKDVKSWFQIKKVVLKDKKYDAGGVPMLLNEKEAYVNNSEDHTLIMGSTGSGKTECGILPTVRILAKAGESVIITDPKGEIYRKTGALLKENGYNIILLNFRNPLEGNAWNPFVLPYRFYKEGKQDKAWELLEDLGQNILIDPNSKGEPFWENASRDYFTGLAIGLFEDATEEEININSINLMATQGEEKIGRSSYDKEYFTMKGETSPAYISASAIITTAQDTKAGVLSTFRTKTRIFSSREILSEMLSHSDFEFSKIGKEKTALFMMIHDEKKTYHALATILVKQIYESLIDTAQQFEDGKLPVRTNFLLDEFANMPALKDVDSMITASRSRNIRFTFIIQNFAQLNMVYGADMAETIKGNCNLHFLLTTELRALEEISKMCGDEKPKKAKEGMPAEPVRPLVSISDLQHMKRFEFLVKRMRSHPFKSKFKPDYELVKENAWNCSYDAMPLPKREFSQVKVFNLKEFVNKKRAEQGIPDFGGMPGGFGGGMPGGFGGGMAGGFNPFMNQMPSSMPGGMPAGMPSGMPGGLSSGMPAPGGLPSSINFEELSKKIDAKIAEIEAEEAREKAEKEGKTIEAPKAATPTEEPKPIAQNEDLENNLEKFKEEVRKQKEARLQIPKEAEYKEYEDKKEEKEEPESIKVIPEEEEEKPKINVDVDSIIVNDNVKDEDFFDDFFDE